MPTRLASGPLFPYLRTVRPGDRATEFRQRCQGLKIEGITLHSPISSSIIVCGVHPGTKYRHCFFSSSSKAAELSTVWFSYFKQPSDIQPPMETGEYYRGKSYYTRLRDY